MIGNILLVHGGLEAGPTLLEALQLSGYHVRLAASAARALEQMAECPATLLIVHLNLPDMRGSTLLPKLRALAPSRDGKPQCIAIGFSGDYDAVRMGTKKGFDYFLDKPFDFDSLNRLVAASVASLEYPPT